MTVAEWIEALREFDPQLTVCLADWNEAYATPNEREAEVLKVVTEKYYNRNNEAVTGRFLKIGSDE